MKFGILTLLCVMMSISMFAQTTVFQENFESIDVKLGSSTTGGGSWVENSTFQSQGLKSYSATVTRGDTTYLTSESFSTLGQYQVKLQFDHIAKIEFADAAIIEVSGDSGKTWERLLGDTLDEPRHYFGTGLFGDINNRFNASSYGNDWDFTDPTTIPQNSWWRTELFDLSRAIPNKKNAMIRFGLIDLNNTGFNGTWYLDSIKVTTSYSETENPIVSLGEVYPIDTLYALGPFPVAAHIKDYSGIDSAYISYSLSSGAKGTITMTNTFWNRFEAEIPFLGIDDVISYKIIAVDASPYANTDSSHLVSFICKHEESRVIKVGKCTEVTSKAPLYIALAKYSNHVSLFTAEEIGTNGSIGGLFWKKLDSEGYTQSDAGLKIYLKHVKFDTLFTDVDTYSIEVANATEVYSSTTQNINTFPGWQEFRFDTTFMYNGEDNLMVIVEWERRSPSVGKSPTWCCSTEEGKAMSWASSVSPPYEPKAHNLRPNIQFDFVMPSLQLDAGIHDVVSPKGSVTLNQIFPVTVDLSNYGIDTLTEVELSFDLNGDPKGTFKWFGSLPKDSVIPVTIGSLSVGEGSYSLRVCAKNPNGESDPSEKNDCKETSFYACKGALQGTYTIDPDGSGVRNFRKVRDAILALTECGIGGAVVFDIADGTYKEQIVLGSITGLSSVNTITFQSVSGDSSLVKFEHKALEEEDNFVVKLNATSNIYFKSISFRALGEEYARVFDLRGVQGIHLSNVCIEAVESPIYENTDMDLIHCSGFAGNNFVLENSVLQGGFRALSLNADVGGASGWVLKGNVVEGHKKSGFALVNAISPVIENNEITADSNSTVDKYFGVSLENSTVSAVISRNRILSQSTISPQGIYVANSTFDLASPAVIKNNFVQVATTYIENNLWSSGIWVNSKNMNIYFNTVKITGANVNSAAFQLYDYLSFAEGIKVFNNNFVNFADGFAVYVNAIDTAKFENHHNNLFSSTATHIANWSRNECSTISSWQTITGEGSGSISYDPYFKSTTDFHIGRRSLDSTATPIAGITHDIDGEIRNTTHPDMGADEFTPVPDDIAILTVLSPEGRCAMGTQEMVTVSFVNTGVKPIKGNFDVKFQVLGDPNIYSESVSDSIGVGDTLVYTFANTYDFSTTSLGQDSNFVIRVWGDLQGDDVMNNDFINQTVESKFTPAAPVVTGDTVLYGDSAIISVHDKQGLIYFWDSDTATIPLVSAPSYTIPVVYDTMTFWASRQVILQQYSVQNGSGTNFSRNVPFPSNPNYSWSRITYDAADLGTRVGLIDSISFDASSVPRAVTMPNQNIYLELVSVSIPHSGSYVNPSTSMTKVFEGTMSFTKAGNYTIVLQEPFMYDGESNLVLQWENLSGISTFAPAFNCTGDVYNKVTYWKGFSEVEMKSSAASDNNRPNMVAHISSISCFSERTPVTVVVDSLPMYDVGIAEVITPRSTHDLTDEEQISVRVKNFGLEACDTIPLAYQFGNSSVIIDTLFQHLGFGESAVFTFNTSEDFSDYKTYDLKAYTLLTKDDKAGNDTIAVQIENRLIPYCACSATFEVSEGINNVKIANLENTSSDTAQLYNDYRLSVAPLVLSPGRTYPISISTGFDRGYDNDVWINVFIDYNHDGIYDSISELAFSSPSTSINTVQGQIIVPNVGVVRGFLSGMRVVMRRKGTQENTGPCGSFAWGEVEDYSVMITPRVAIDAGVMEVLLASDTTNESYLTPIEAVVFNDGQDTITTMDVDYTLNNGSPVSKTISRIIAPGGIDTVQLTPFISPKYSYDICVKAKLNGDLNAYNDNVCRQFFGQARYDGAILDMEDIEQYCGMKSDTIIVRVLNAGVDTINGSTQATPTTISYQLNQAAVVTEPLELVLAAGEIGTYRFKKIADIESGDFRDSIFDIRVWISHPDDKEGKNDTLQTILKSLHIPLVPTVSSPVNAGYGSPVTLAPSSLDLLRWFKSDTSSEVIGLGEEFTTPYLFADDTFYVEAMSRLTEEFAIGSKTTTNMNLPGNMRSRYSYTQSIYKANYFGDKAGDITKIAYNYEGGKQVYTDDLRIYMGITNKTRFSTSADWIPISEMTLVYEGNFGATEEGGWFEIELDVPFKYDGSANLVIAFDENAVQSTNSIGSFYCSALGDNVSIYSHNDNLNPDPDNPPSLPAQYQRVIDVVPDIRFEIAPEGCIGPRVPVHINIGAQAVKDVGVISIDSSNSTYYLSSHDTVKVKVMNFGTAAQSNIPVSIELDGNHIAGETILSTIAPGDTLEYTFSKVVDLRAMDKMHELRVYTGLNDANPLNDTLTKRVQSERPDYCASYAKYSGGLFIEELILNRIANASPRVCALYTDYTELSTVLNPGYAYPLELRVNSCDDYQNKGAKVWIDFNRDGDFDDANEEVANFAPDTVTRLYSKNIMIPADVELGLTTMRIVAREIPGANNANIQSCGNYNFGETEDYTVVLKPKIANDAGVELFTDMKVIADSSNLLLKARVRNYGFDPIASVDIKYGVNGGISTFTYNLASIAPSDYVDVDLGTILLNEGRNQILAYTELVGDVNNDNDTLQKDVYLEEVVLATYSDDFEGVDIWILDTVQSQWERGVPSMSRINTAHSPSNAWGVNLDANYANNSTENLYSPKIVIPDYADSAYFKFWHAYETQEGNDGGYVQYRVNSGEWKNMGYMGDPSATNWFTHNINGSHAWSGIRSWHQSVYPISFSSQASMFFNADTVQFRFVFVSDNYVNDKDGWVIDDFELDIPRLDDDIEVVSLESPIGGTQVGTPQTVSAIIKNVGNKPQDTIPVSYMINSFMPVEQEFIFSGGGLLPDSSAFITFDSKQIIPGTSFEICVSASLKNDVNTYNDTKCETLLAAPAKIDAAVNSVIANPALEGDTTLTSQSAAVTVEIINVGIDVITSIPVEYSIDDRVIAKENWSGSLNAGDTAMHTFARTYYGPLGHYHLCAKTTYSGDPNPYNDRVCKFYFGKSDVGINTEGISAFSLSQNQPNPASGSLRIKYSVPKDGKARFEMRNALGQSVMAKELSANFGQNTIVLDVSALPVGIYYYTVEYDNQRLTRKMIVNR